MAEPTVEERLLYLEDMRFVHGFVLKYVLRTFVTTQEGRDTVREQLCGTIERFFADRLTESGYPRLQAMLAEVEGLCDTPKPRHDT